jgi:hypothetical protein
MKYVMFIVHDPDHSPEDAAAAPGVQEWFEFAREGNHYDLGVRLHDAPAAKTLRIRAGKELVTDGPFTESKEWIAGVALIEAASIDEALDLARRNPAAYHGRVELREVHSWGGPLAGD